MAFAAKAAQLVSALLSDAMHRGASACPCFLAGSIRPLYANEKADPLRGPALFILVAGTGFVLFRQSSGGFA
jgi:hypothetical protein